jgi:hypothetical protein
MHILMLVVFGFIALAVFVAGASMFNRRGGSLNGAEIFIVVWLVAALVNSVVGVVYAGSPLLNEAGAFVVIFGLPAAVAWYLSRRYKATSGDAIKDLEGRT